MYKIQKSICFLILAMFLIAGCSSTIVSPETASPQVAFPTIVTRTATADQQKTRLVLPTLTGLPPTLIPSITPSFVLSTKPLIEYLSPKLLKTFPDGATPSGSLLLLGKSDYLLDLSTNIREDIPDKECCISTSPDGKWLAYFKQSNASPTGRWLIVVSADKKQKKSVPVDERITEFGSYTWLDNQRLIFPLFRQMGEIHPMVVINPFTGEQIELASDYPGFEFNPGVPNLLQFVYSNLVYDPSLNLVVYPMEQGVNHYIVLWDRQAQKALTKIESPRVIGNYPLWAPDGKHFVVAVRIPIQGRTGVSIETEDWFFVSREGEVKRLTDFAENVDRFGSVELGDASWSPDGQTLAFWLDMKQGPCAGGHLATLDITTLHVINYCMKNSIESATSTSKPPIWSLDSRFIALDPFFNLDLYGPMSSAIIEIKHNLVVIVSEDARAFGWLRAQ